VEREIGARCQLRPIGSSEPGDIWIAGYPKSGNTWFQNLVAAAVYGVMGEHVPDALMQDLVPDIYHRAYYRRYGERAYFKTHELPRPEYRRVVYLVRDGRDALASYLHYLKAFERKSVDPVAAAGTGEGLYPSHWADHVAQWRANPHGSEVLLVRYEDLKRDCAGELARFCAFAGIERTAEHLELAARSCAFEVMRRREEALGWDREGWSREERFVRRGEVGGYRDELGGEVQEAFLAKGGAMLRELGYL
jgi:hypothetical protein